jgi:hypothetical protein
MANAYFCLPTNWLLTLMLVLFLWSTTISCCVCRTQSLRRSIQKERWQDVRHILSTEDGKARARTKSYVVLMIIYETRRLSET